MQVFYKIISKGYDLLDVIYLKKKSKKVQENKLIQILFLFYWCTVKIVIIF